MASKPSGPMRLLQVVALALFAFGMSWALGDLHLGIVSAGAILLGELIWVGGRFAVRSVERHRSRA